MSQNDEAQAPVTPNPAMLRLLTGASPENQHAVLTEAGPTIQGIALDSILAADPDMNSPDYYPALAWFWRHDEYRLHIQTHQGANRWTKERRDTLTRLLEAAMPAMPRQPLPEPLTGTAWQETPPEREWLVRDWLPAGELCLLTGPGSVGKSLLALQLGAALACDRRALRGYRGWLPSDTLAVGTPMLTPEPVAVALAGWEDTAGEVLRRRARLADAGGCEWARDLSINERLHALPMRGHGPLWAPVGHGHVATVGDLTDTGRALRTYCEQHSIQLVVVDTVAHALTVDENSRALVMAALESWAGWASSSGCTILLTGHPAKATEGEGADYSGSTAWRGSVRAMWTLRKPSDVDADELRTLEGDPAQPERVARLSLNKSNYGFDGVHLDLVTVGRRAGWRLVEPLATAKPARKGRARDTDFADVTPNGENPYQ